MPLTNLEHYLVRAKDMEATKDFYVDALGFRVGHRPPFDFAGYWLYLGDADAACVHLIPAAPNEKADAYLEVEAGEAHGSGAIDHLAFRGTDLKGFAAKMKKLDISFLHRVVPDMGLHQVFIKDPDGVTLELNYAAEDAVGYEPEA